jgi:hypothetical protein
MANDKSPYLKDAIINFVLLNDTGYNPAASSVYIALFNGNPLVSGTEVSGGGYTRQHVTFTSASSGQTQNSNLVSFGTATSPGYGLVDYFALYDQSTGGNILYADALISSQTISTGFEARFIIGSITVSE